MRGLKLGDRAGWSVTGYGILSAARDVLLLVMLLFVSLLELAYVVRSDFEADDFAATIWTPAVSVLAGTTPYPDPSLQEFFAQSVYPPLVFLAALPLTALSYQVAVGIWVVLLAFGTTATLWVLGVRDWRCYACYVGSAPVVFGLLWGNVTLLVVLLVALVWRYREHTSAGLFLAIAIAIKLLVAPLWLWLLYTKRYRAALYCAIAAPVLIVAPWATLGFDGFMGYSQRLSMLADEYRAFGIGVQSLASQLGFDGEAPVIATVAATACLIAAYRSKDEFVSFAWSLGAILAFSPILWIHYYALLVVPLAIAFPRFGGAWWLFAALWVTWIHSPLPWGSPQLSVIVLALAFLLLSFVAHGRTRARWISASTPDSTPPRQRTALTDREVIAVAAESE